jgi:hypothetical protein
MPIWDAAVKIMRGAQTILASEDAQIIPPTDMSIAAAGGEIRYRAYLPEPDALLIHNNDMCYLLSWDGHTVDSTKPHTVLGIRTAGNGDQAHTRIDLPDLYQ